MKSFAQIDRETNGDYVQLLKSVTSLSGLFSDSEAPLITGQQKTFFVDRLMPKIYPDLTLHLIAY